MTRHRIAIVLAVAGLSALAFYLRALPAGNVFQDGFVNFTETDAWFHARSIDHLVRNFPSGMGIDPYFKYGNTQGPPAGPFFDWVCAGAAWAAGAGHPSEKLIGKIAAWYPAVLGALIVPAIFLLGRAVFGTAAGLIAAAVGATLPGHFLEVGSVGYTDHHVMESLLAAVVLWLLARAIDGPPEILRFLAAGVALGAYLLTFVGGAFLVAVIAGWAAYEVVRPLWPGAQPFSLRPVYWIFGIAAAIVAPFYRVLWMPFSIAALLGGALVLAALDRWRTAARTRGIFLVGMTGAATVAIAAAAKWNGGLGSVLMRLTPSAWGSTGGVQELQSLVYSQGFFSLAWAWQQFAGAYVLAIVALFLLAELCIRRPERRRDLVFFFGLATFLLAAAQVRMTYYFGVAAAIFSGFLASKAFDTRSRGLVAAGVLGALLFWPNISHAIESGDRDSGVSADWRESLEWLRSSTEEPFGDANFYYARYGAPVRPAYSVMAWWDFGYWITAVARRVPVTNPSQANARAAASFFLSQSEAEARPILDSWKSRYVIVSRELPLFTEDSITHGFFGNFFEYDRSRRLEDYVVTALDHGQERLLYKPAYYRCMAVRLFLFGAAAVDEPSGAALAILRPGGKLPELVSLRKFPSAREAESAEPGCRAEGCILVGANSAVSCVRLEALTGLRQVHASPTPALRIPVGGVRNAVQIYQVF